MAVTKFIKTTVFGGYDKKDVDKRLDYLYSQIYDLKNELRETKLLLEEYKKGTDEEKTHEAILIAERTRLTGVQVQNETLSQKLKEIREENKSKDKETAELKKEIETLKKELNESKTALAGSKSNNEASILSTVFIEAQKTAGRLVDDAKKEADNIIQDSKKLAENVVTEANNTAAKIVYEAEKEAADINAASENNAEQMKAASGNLRAVMLKDVEDITKEISKIKALFISLKENGLVKINESEQLLERTRNKLRSEGVPVFTVPEKVKPVAPKPPKYKPVDTNYITGSSENPPKKAKNEDLEKLMAMANALDGKKSAAPSKPDAKSANAASRPDAKSANAASRPDAKPANAPSKADAKPVNNGAADDLAKLMAMAEALND